MQIICANPQCGYRGKAKRIPRGSLLTGCLLSLLMILPGLLYFAFRGGYRYICPRCGLEITADR